MRKIGITLACASVLSGCAYFPDFEVTPSARLPVAEVINQIRCDMYEFLKDNKPGGRTFSLDEESYATVELTLSTTAFGDVKFSKIDAIGLGASNWLAAGSSSQPFPSIGVKPSSQVVTKVQVNISQKADDLREKCERGGTYGYAEILSNKPEADRVLINQLRVASWLKRTFESGDRIAGNENGYFCNAKSASNKVAKKEDTCSVSLETATLTTKFQIIGDVSGGLLSLEKIIPVVATPTLQLNADYFHQIQIIFQGNNVVDEGKATTTYAMRAVARQKTVERKFNTLTNQRGLNCSESNLKKNPQLVDICKNLQRKVEIETPLPPAPQRTTNDDARAVARQLRSIRDALILNNNRP